MFEKRSGEGFINREYLEQASLKAKESLRADVIDMDEFSEDYGKDAIERDRNYVSEMEVKFREDETEASREANEFADILEAIMNEQIELSDWFGEDVWMRKTTRFDDIKNGIDTIAEIRREGGVRFLGMAIDVTFSSKAIAKKLKRSKEEIDRGTLAEVKYFTDSNNTIRGRLKKIPRVVIGADQTTIRELAGLWVNGKKKELAEHPFQIELLDEVISQLEYSRDYAASLGESRKDIVAIFDSQIDIFKKILVKKNQIKQDSEEKDVRIDKVHEAIRENARNLYRL